MPPAHKTAGMRKPKDAKGTFFRILSYLSPYKWPLILVAVFVVISSGAGVVGTYFLKPIVDDYIVPLIGSQNPDFSGLLSIIIMLAVIYALGALCTYGYNRIMVNVAAGSLYRMRMDMFTHMQKLPIRYFDTRTHGEIMSRYTNDIDTLRNMMSQSIPQLISSAITVIGVFSMMLVLSIPLTVLVVLMMLTMIWVIKKIGGKSSMYYRNQQKAIGAVNGYIEEMIDGQRVVKVFCHGGEQEKL